MLTAPNFFLDHQLTADADERAVKRAYARSLKKIDQETDLEAFQALRESYDAALSWLRYREQFRVQPEVLANLRMEEHDIAELVETTSATTADTQLETTPARQDASAEDDSLPQEEPDIAQDSSGHHEKPTLIDKAPTINPGQVAEQIFNEMLDAMRQHADNNKFAEQNLIAILDDPRLFHMEARPLFETALAEYLLQGWQPGNGELFDVAAQIFGWMTDRPRLLQLGRAGWLIDQALTSAAEFYSKDKKARAKLWALVLDIRTEKSPTRFYVKANLALFQHMQDTCYSWLRLVTNRENLEQWSAVAKEINAQESIKIKSAFSPEETKSTYSAYWIVTIVLMLILVFSNIDRSAPKYDPGQSAPSAQLPFDLDKPDVRLTQEQKIEKAEILLARSNEDKGNYNMAVRSLEILAGEDNAKAAYRLGWVYRDGKYLPEDKQRQYAWFLRAAELGHIQASIIVGDLLVDGLGDKPNYQEAFKHYKKAADNGDALGLSRLAYMIDRGYGGKAGRVEAVHLIKSSADKGFAYSESLMGQFHLRGEYGFPRDEVKSANWFSLSAQHGDASGERYFGLVHEQGLGSYKINLEEAVKWYRKAMDHGDKEAEESLQRLCKKQEFSECKPGPASINTISVVSKVN